MAASQLDLDVLLIFLGVWRVDFGVFGPGEGLK
jgi:hypothetical protein